MYIDIDVKSLPLLSGKTFNRIPLFRLKNAIRNREIYVYVICAIPMCYVHPVYLNLQRFKFFGVHVLR